MRKSICIISFSPIASDARVLRQIRYLSRRHDLTVVGYGPPPPDCEGSPSISWIQLDQPAKPNTPRLVAALKNLDFENVLFWLRVRNKLRNILSRVLLIAGKVLPRSYDAWYRLQTQYAGAMRAVINTRCNAYHANDWDSLPLAAAAAKKNNAYLVMDLHEYAPLEYEDRPRWWIQKGLITYILKKYSTGVSAVTTVAEPIAERYRQEFGFNVRVIMNAPEVVSLPLQKGSDSSIRLIHHGVASSIRKPELMIETIALCEERYSLHFMFISNDYVEHLKTLAEKLAPGRVFFHDPVPPEDITREISQYDVGFFMIPPTNYNYHVCLPNKFFDFISSGLAVAIGPSPSMAEWVDKYGLGVVCNSFNPSDMASMLNKISLEQWMDMKKAARKASQEINAQTEMNKLIEIYDALFMTA